MHQRKDRHDNKWYYPRQFIGRVLAAVKDIDSKHDSHSRKNDMQIGIMHSEALEDDKNESKLQCKKQDNSGFL